MSIAHRPLAYVGSRTTRARNARGAGLTVWHAGDAEWRLAQTLSDLVNPSFLAFDRSGRFLYAVHGDETEISAFRIDPGTGLLEFVNRVSTGGRNPVHLVVDPANRHVVVANHGSSSLAVLPIRSDGALAAVSDLVTLTGQIGPHRVEQPFAKPHQVAFDRSGTFLAVPDKGLDRVFVFRLDAAAGKLVALPDATMVARESAGPRHLCFHPGNAWAYVVNELDSTINACRFDPRSGRLEPFQVLPSLPDSCVGASRAAEIDVSPDGRFVFASNRGHDSIGAFAVDAGSGRLVPTGWQQSGGRTPRFFAVGPVARSIFVANEDGDDIRELALDASTGTLAPGRVVARTSSPVCILLRPVAAQQRAA